MGWISHIDRKDLMRLLTRGGIGLVGLFTIGAMLVTVPGTAHRQDETSYWNAYARNYLDNRFAPESKQITELQDISDVKGLETFTRVHLDNAMSQMKQFDCLATAIYYEARSEPVAGQIAVGKVVMNRVASRYYPNTVCQVVYQGAARKTGCQFSFTCDGSLQHPPRDAVWARSEQSALNVWLGLSDVTIGHATHYHTVAVDPKWAKYLMRTADVGSHIFYRFPNRREKAMLDSEI